MDTDTKPSPDLATLSPSDGERDRGIRSESVSIRGLTFPMRSGWLLILIGFQRVFWGGTYSAFRTSNNKLNPGQVVTLPRLWRSRLLLLLLAADARHGSRGRDLIKTVLMWPTRLRLRAAPAAHQDASRSGGRHVSARRAGAARHHRRRPLFLRETHVPANRWIGFSSA